MPAYTFMCTECASIDTRIAAMFEDEATCVQCGELMYRLDDPFVCADAAKRIVLWDEGSKPQAVRDYLLQWTRGAKQEASDEQA